MKKKLITIAIIALFLGLAVSPSIHADIDRDGGLVEITTEFCGINRSPHKVKLTQEQAGELDILFDNIKNRLDKVETREEAEEIFKQAIIELDRYGLLGGLSIEQAQRLVTGGYQNREVIELLENIYSRNQGFFDNNSNFLCLIVGRSSTVFFMGPIVRGMRLVADWVEYLGYLLYWWLIEHNVSGNIIGFVWIINMVLGFLFEAPTSYLQEFNRLTPISIGKLIIFGQEYWKSHGWLFTIGLNGIKSWKGSFVGQIVNLPIYWRRKLMDLELYPGVTGFVGLKATISHPYKDIIYFGSAIYAKIGPDFPS